ncbi:MAG: hypothetical protein KAS18_00880 [Calditrichia bacterium]|nr:hypothetical protein [Calditrichia bacterium]
MFSNFGLQDLTNIFNMLGVVVAIIIYIVNSIHSNRQRSIDNAMRYFEYHSKILSIDGYCRTNVKEMENGTYKRDLNDHEMEMKFNQFMSNCEHLALLQKA